MQWADSAADDLYRDASDGLPWGLRAGTQPADAAAGEDDEAEETVQRHRWMACCHLGGQLGVATYDRLTGKVQLMQVADDSKGPFAYQMLQYVKLQTSPDVICISSGKSDTAFVAACRQPLPGDGDVGFCVQLERSTIFNHDKALQMLESLRVRSLQQSGSDNRREWLALLNTAVDLSKELQVCALGALVAILRKEDRAIAAEAEHGTAGGAVVVDSIQEMSLQGCLMMDAATLHALDIFREERHPSNMGIGSTKEGFSLFGLLQRCVTQMEGAECNRLFGSMGLGKRLLRLWFLCPNADVAQLQNRHDTIELLLQAPELMSRLRVVVKKVHDLPRLLARLQLMQGRPDAGCFRQMLGSLEHLLQLRHVIEGLAGQKAHSNTTFGGLEEDMDMDLGFITPRADGGPANGRGSPWASVGITAKLLEAITTDVLSCHAMITDVVHPDADTAEEGGGLVLPGVCDQLDELRQAYHSLPDFLTSVVEQELARIPAHIARRYAQQLWAIVYIPQLGYVMQVSGSQLSEELRDLLPDYELAFAGEEPGGAGFAAHYYTEATKKLNGQFGDMLYKVQDLEASICTELVKRVLAFTPQLHAAAAAVAELDCLVSLALCARELGYTRPELTTGNELCIEQGRHPLMSMLVDTCIPNDTNMPEDAGRVHVITGPNASGKSCYTKQVGLIVFLAHVGSFVPASRCVVGLTDRILVRIVSQEQLALQQSTFMADLTQVASIVRKATSRSLIIIDEFGKGTLSSDGVGLLTATLSHFTAMPQPPKTLVCTHFNELFEEWVLPPTPQLHCFTMEVVVISGSAGMGGGVGDQGGLRRQQQGQQQEQQQEQQGQQQQQQQSLEEVVFLYRLAPGRVAPSFGLHCARTCGVREPILARAAEVISLHTSGHSVPRLQLPSLAARDAHFSALVARLANLDVTDSAAVLALLRDVLKDGSDEGGAAAEAG